MECTISPNIREKHNVCYNGLMKTVIKSSNDRHAVVVPVVSLEELPHLTTEERATLISELEKTLEEAEMKAGQYFPFSPRVAATALFGDFHPLCLNGV